MAEQSAKKSHNDGTYQRIPHDSSVEVDFFHAWQVCRKRSKHLRGRVSYKQAKRGARNCQNKNLGHELSDDGGPCAAKRKSDGDFVLALSGAGQKQCNDVRTSDQEKHRHGAKQDPQRSPHATNGFLFEWPDPHSQVRIRFRKCAAELFLHCR